MLTKNVTTLSAVGTNSWVQWDERKDRSVALCSPELSLVVGIDSPKVANPFHIWLHGGAADWGGMPPPRHSPIIGLSCDSTCLLYTSDAADEEDSVDLGGRRIIKKKNK
eukprot:TRINITY_DN24377_c0_g1_i1.p1 TRINITY_DN24377_c0_g1~~TRINITY_DN24377_c0_g1_i1.p1  ORF type:complete len:109 (+),score=13.09 TRINITY_DN24377_c0_g1_i1:261-587(+)